MAHCTKCNYKWKVKELLTFLFSKKGKACPNCGEKQYLSAETQRTLTLGSFSLLFLLLTPFIKVKLSDKDEPLW